MHTDKQIMTTLVFSLFSIFFLLVSLAAALIFLLFKVVVLHPKTSTMTKSKLIKSLTLPPSPPKLPIIGNLHLLGTLPHRSLDSLSTKYGPDGLMLLHLGRVPTLIVSSAEMAEAVMKTHDLIFANRPITTASYQLSYSCSDIAFAPYGEYWRQVRKLCTSQLLSAKRVSSHRPVREEEVGLMIERIMSHVEACGGEEGGDYHGVNITELLLCVSSGIITRIAFGRKYTEGEAKLLVMESLNLLVSLFGEQFVGDYFPWLAWVDVLRGADARLKRSFRRLDAFLDQVIEDHLLKRKMDSEDSMEQRDLVDILLSLQEDSKLGIQLSGNNLKGIILDMFAAGTDTTAITLEWAMAELMRHPHVMRKAQREVREVVGKNSRVTEDHLNLLNYSKLVIKETLRLHPPAPLLVARESSVDISIQGYHIPAKTRVFVSAWTIGRDQKIWRNADEFLPERFMTNAIDFKRQNFHLIPFGAGRRACPGISYAMATAELVLANLLYWFDWNLPRCAAVENLDMTEVFGLALHKKSPLCLVPKPHFSGSFGLALHKKSPLCLVPQPGLS